jgi:hypothetical protein
MEKIRAVAVMIQAASLKASFFLPRRRISISVNCINQVIAGQIPIEKFGHFKMTIAAPLILKRGRQKRIKLLIYEIILIC